MTKDMQIKSAKNKGRELENFIVQLLRESGLDSRASRNPGSGSGNRQKGDVWNALGLCIEAKNTVKAPGKAEFDQVRREAGPYETEVIVWHPPKLPLDDSKVILNIHDFIELLKKGRDPKTEKTSPNLAFKMRRARQSLQEVLKEMGDH